uniref:NS1 n=1 Tax=Tasmanian devil-associated chapparvovirus 3 TaxID=2529484 RepID=A0A481W7U8_9VIRU|nr:NS1 [Tasmanian devil-associated chapparvovirus 3]
MSTVTYSNLQYAYIKNDPYVYPTDDSTSGSFLGTQLNTSTGWQIIPNLMWSHLLTPKDMCHLKVNYQAYSVKSISATVFNMIPLTETLAIQGNVTFAAFNNTIYAVGYTDDLYETSPFDWQTTAKNFNLAYKEGARYSGGGSQAAGNAACINLPTYNFVISQPGFPGATLGRYDGLFWDPFNRPDKIMELRPGKNAIKFSWETHEADKGIWYNLDSLGFISTFKVDGVTNETQNNPLKITIDDGITASRNDMIYQPIVRTWYLNYNLWKARGSNIGQMNPPPLPTGQASRTPVFGPKDSNILDTGPESQNYKYPPTQWFIKLLPLYDANNALINTRAQIGILKTVVLEVKPRTSAYYAPSYNMWTVSPAETYSVNMGLQNYDTCIVRPRSCSTARQSFTTESVYASTTSGLSGTTSTLSDSRFHPYK